MLWWKLHKLRRLRYLDPDDVPAKAEAVSSILGYGARAVPGLLGVLKSSHWESTREIAIMALGRLQDDRAIDALVNALDDRGVRYAASEALQRFEHPHVSDALERFRQQIQSELDDLCYLIFNVDIEYRGVLARPQYRICSVTGPLLTPKFACDVWTQVPEAWILPFSPDVEALPVEISGGSVRTPGWGQVEFSAPNYPMMAHVLVHDERFRVRERATNLHRFSAGCVVENVRTPFLIVGNHNRQPCSYSAVVELLFDSYNQTPDFQAYVVRMNSLGFSTQQEFDQYKAEKVEEAKGFAPSIGDLLPIGIDRDSQYLPGALRLNEHITGRTFRSTLFFADYIPALQPGTQLIRRVAWRRDDETTDHEIVKEVAQVIG